jgi:hypothetical protein
VEIGVDGIGQALKFILEECFSRLRRIGEQLFERNHQNLPRFWHDHQTSLGGGLRRPHMGRSNSEKQGVV